MADELPADIPTPTGILDSLTLTRNLDGSMDVTVTLGDGRQGSHHQDAPNADDNPFTEANMMGLQVFGMAMSVFRELCGLE